MSSGLEVANNVFSFSNTSSEQPLLETDEDIINEEEGRADASVSQPCSQLTRNKFFGGVGGSTIPSFLPSYFSSFDNSLKEMGVERYPGWSVADIVREKIKKDEIEEGPFYVSDLGVLLLKYEQWTRLLPRVEPFYAIKCNPDVHIMKALLACGTGFDCASKEEISKVRALGVDTDKIIMANPCKPISHLKFARSEGVKMMTFDNAEELRKIKKTFPEAELVLRILPDDSHSVCRFGSKFGASPSVCAELFALAAELQINIIGISFHVGSGCLSVQAFSDALKLARSIFDEGERQGFALNFLDIGGGFPGTDSAISFTEIASAISPLLDEFFPPHVRIIGEPGRYFAAATQTLAVSVFARRDVSQNEEGASERPKYLYYVNDGVYGSFNCIFFDHVNPHGYPLEEKPESEKNSARCNVFGPTCDSLDLICKDVVLPKLEVGDWLYFPEMGAYTTAASSQFNGFPMGTAAPIYYVSTLSL